MRTLLATALGASIALSGWTGAQASEADNDMMCIVVVGVMSSNKQYEDAAKMGGAYYIGKILGREPNYDFEGAARRLAPRMKPDVIRSEALRCGAEMKELGVHLQAVGKSLKNMQVGAPT